MAMKFSIKDKWVKSVLFTSLFCAIIAFATMLVWPSSYYDHALISFGYGYSAIISARIITWRFPSLTARQTDAFSVIGALIFGSLNAGWWLGYFHGDESAAGIESVIMLGAVFTVTCFYYFYAHEQKIIADKELERLKRVQSEQEKAIVLGELKQLQSQIEPHFLFNTLANINVLIEHDPSKAQRMLTQLTELLRATLKKNRTQLSTIKEELDLVAAYLEIQQIRLGDDFTFDIECEDKLAGLALPPLLLQPLVENAVLHGVEPLAERGHIHVSIKRETDTLCVRVSDNGQGLNPASPAHQSGGNGIGLQNVRERLTALFEADANLQIKENPLKGVTSQICIGIPSMETLSKNKHDKKPL